MALVFVSTVSAETLKTGRYRMPGGNITLWFHVDGTVQGSIGDSHSVLARGKYRISGNRLVISFSGASGELANLAGRSVVYTISDDETFTDGSETWIYIG